MADYLQDGHRTVSGWFSFEDRVMFTLVDNVQRELSLQGDLLEIGAFEGKSAILLGYMLQPDEQLTVCDIFAGEATNERSAEENDNWYGGLTRQIFERNYLRFHVRLPRVIEEPSTDLRAQCELGQFRFLHVDGSHIYPDVLADLLLSKDLVCGTDAVVAIDDIRSPHTPGVWAATWECVHQHGLVPFAVTGKMYATWGTPSHQFQELVARGLRQEQALSFETHPIADRNVARVFTNPSFARPSRLGQIALDWMPPRLRKRLL